jgi:anti-sigma factor RsiW
MDKCNHIKDLILTDYMDDQIDDALKKQVESHLHQCASCRAFALESQENLAVPFQKLDRQVVPAHLWKNIQEKIQEEQSYQPSFLDLAKDWIGGITFPKLVPVLASLVLVVLIGSNVMVNQQVQQAQQVQEEEQVIYLASVFSSVEQTDALAEKGLETPIEQYFL